MAALAADRLGRRVFALAALPPAAALVWAALQAPAVLGGRPLTRTSVWVPGLSIELGFRLDAFALLMVLLVSGVGLLVCWYSAGWFARPGGRAAAGTHRFAAWLVLFAGSMLGLVLADNLLVLYVCWELTTVTSYLLIGFDDVKAGARAAALQALVVTSAGGLALLAGLVVLAQAAGTYSLAGLLAAPPSGTAAAVGAGLVLAGAFTKSAQVPFHGWLPAAMVAPTPVSAYLHAAAMVKAGVYLVARFAPAFAQVGLWRPAVLAAGLASLLFGGWRALRQHDLKLLLAYGTVSQLGLLMVLLGLGHPAATAAGVTLLTAHALFKGSAFLLTGVVERAAGTRDLRRLSGLGRRLPVLGWAGVLAAASMAGVPPLLGYLAKESAYQALLDSGAAVTLALVVAGSVLTAAYSARWLHGAFAPRGRERQAGARAADVPRAAEPPAAVDLDPPSRSTVAAGALMAALGLALGLVPVAAGALLEPAAGALDPAAGAESLALWHGLNAAVGLSVLALALALALFAARAPVERLQARLAVAPRGWERAWRAGVRAQELVAFRVTGFTQSGSLPVYLGVALLVVLALPGAALARAGLPPGPVAWFDTPVQPVVAVVMVLAGVGAAAATRRLAAVLLVGAVGYGVATLFVLQGAPDLALTQFLIETLTLVVFGLVLRRLPSRFSSRPWRPGLALRAAIAGGVGVFVTAFALVADAARRRPPVSTAYLERALGEGGGRNVVNVILVDFRGFDTMGEITVLAVAALGFVSLLRLGFGGAAGDGGAAEDDGQATP